MGVSCIVCRSLSLLLVTFLFDRSFFLSDRTDTQPTKSRWEVASDSEKKKVLGGTKTGNGAWALAWVDTVMELPSPDHVGLEDIERDKLMKSIEA
jgi:hypothetical protein